MDDVEKSRFTAKQLTKEQIGQALGQMVASGKLDPNKDYADGGAKSTEEVAQELGIEWPLKSKEQ